MNRWRAALGAGALLAFVGASPALAQYATTTTTAPTTTTTAPTTTTTRPTTTTTRPTTTTTRPTSATTAPINTTTTNAPPPAQVSGTTSNPTPRPGDAVPIAAPQVGNQPAIAANRPVAAVLVPASGDADIAMPTPVITQNANGSVSISVTVPPSTPPGVYLIAVVGQTPSGQSRAIIIPVVVRRRVTAAAVPPTRAQALAAATPASVVVPSSIRKELDDIVASVAEVGGAAAVEDAVLNEGAELHIDDARLLVSRTGEGEGDGSRPLVAAFAVALGGAGLVLVRRRTPAISTRSR